MHRNKTTILKQNPLRDTFANKWCYQEPQDGITALQCGGKAWVGLFQNRDISEWK